MLSDTLTFVDGADWNYDISGSTLSTPNDGDIITRFVASRAYKIPQNASGSRLAAATGPGAAQTLIIKIFVDGVEEGSFTFTQGGGAGAAVDVDLSATTVAGNISSAAVEVAIGEVVTIEADTLNGSDDLAVTIKSLAT